MMIVFRVHVQHFGFKVFVSMEAGTPLVTQGI